MNVTILPPGPPPPMQVSMSTGRGAPFTGEPRTIRSPERRLFQAIILISLQDLAVLNITSLEREHARRWLLDGGKDFRIVCDMAGLSAEMVRKAAQRIIQKKRVRKPAKVTAEEQREYQREYQKKYRRKKKHGK